MGEIYRDSIVVMNGSWTLNQWEKEKWYLSKFGAVETKWCHGEPVVETKRQTLNLWEKKNWYFSKIGVLQSFFWGKFNRPYIDGYYLPAKKSFSYKIVPIDTRKIRFANLKKKNRSVFSLNS